MIHHVQPIEVLHLFPVLDRELLTLLHSLGEADWNKPTIPKKWTVKDIVAHLLDGNIRTISMLRDGYFGEQPGNIPGYKELVQYLNRLNAQWTDAMKRLSPQLLIELIAHSGPQYVDTLAKLDPWGDAVFSVAWAGEEISKNWFHIAREYTEKWLHQQQIRDAVGKPGIMTRELFYPFIDTMMCGLPQTYHKTRVPTGTSVMVRIDGEPGGEWHINKTEEGWVLRKETRIQPNAVVDMTPDTAWRLFSKGMTPDEAADKVQVTGDKELGRITLNMVSVMA